MPRGVPSALLLLTLTWAPPANAQAPAARPAVSSPPPIAFATAVEDVHLTVTVTDEAGRPVTDLKPEDFVVLENGRAQKVHLFARSVEVDEGSTAARRDALALDLGMLLDTSTSMLTQLKQSQEAAVRFLEAVPRARELITIFFDDEIRVSQYNSENQQGLIERIHEAKGGGDTALYDAMAVYLSRIQGSPGRKTLVLFTDGEDSRSELNMSELVRLVRASPVTIYSVAFAHGLGHANRAMRARAFLEQMSELTGGKVFYPRTSRDLPGMYRKILDELAAQYVLGYASDDTRRDGAYRKLEVELARPELRVRHRAGYYAPGGDPEKP